MIQRILKPFHILTDLSKVGRAFAVEHHFDSHSFFEQNVSWGDLDSFQHVNNAQYLRFFESGRMRWLQELALEAGGEQAAEKLLKGKGVSLILKKTEIDYKCPVNYPDTLLIAHKFMPQTSDPAHLIMHAIAYSTAQERVTTKSTATCVWYDYDQLKKASQGPPSPWKSAIGNSRHRTYTTTE